MSFDKDYPNRKDWREPYHDSRAFDSTCRNHGSCGWCVGNRTHKNKQKAVEAKETLEQYKRYGDEYDIDELDDTFIDPERENYLKWLEQQGG